MIQSVVVWSDRFRLLVLGLAAALLVYGFTQLPSVAIDRVPEFTPPYVEIQTEALGLSAEEVEQLITVPLEADLLNGVAWLDSIQSQSINGLSSIVLIFEPGTDVLRARQMVAERLTQAHALPNVSKPPVMLQPLSSTSRVMMIGLSSDELSLIEMSVLARWTIRPRLLGVPGVANVAIWGQRERQLQVLVDPRRLREHGVTLQDVIKTTGNALWVSPLTFLEASTPGTGGFIETPNQRLGVQHVLPISSAEHLARVAVERDDPVENAPGLRLGDVAEVVEDHQPLIGDAIVNGGAGLLLVVEKFPNANTLEVTRGIDETLEALGPGLAGMVIDPTIFRPAGFIETAMGNVSLALIIGFALAALVLGAILYSWRSLLICLVAIPLAVATAALVLHLFGVTFNVMILGGLALAVAVVVDDAVAGVHGVVRRLHEPRGGEGRLGAILAGTLETRQWIVYGTAIALVAVVPALFAGGMAAPFLPVLVLAFAVAVLCSTAVALTVVVALARLLLVNAPIGARDSPLLRPLQRGYHAALSRLIGRPRPVFATAAAVTLGVFVLVGVGIVPRLGESLVPEFRERDLIVRVDAQPGTSRVETSRMVAEAARALDSIDGVGNVGAHIGRAVLSDQLVGVNSAEIWLSVDPAAEYRTTLAAIQETLAAYPGLRQELSTYQAERFRTVLADSAADVVVRVYGQESPALEEQADEVRRAVAEIDGIAAATLEPRVEEPTLEIQVDLAAAERHGIKPGDVRRTATTLLSGMEVGALFEEQKVFEVVVWGMPEIRDSINSVRNILIDTPDGSQVPLDDVADVRIVSGPALIQREGVARRIDVNLALSGGRDAAAVADEVESRLASVDFPLEYHAEVLRLSEDRQTAQLALLTAILASGVAVFLLFQAAFESWRLAGVAFLALPVALVGSAFAAWLNGPGLSIGALAGFFAVLAIAARNGIMLIALYRRHELETGEPAGEALVLRGATERMPVVLASALATSAALLPFVLLGDLPGFELVGPMSLVIIGGLISSTLVNLFLMPAAYPRSGPRPQPEMVPLEVEVRRPETQPAGAGR